jgi:S1-C subfamily serine protease
VAPADWIVLGVVCVAGLYGLLNGLVRGSLSLAGFALGAYLGARVAPDLLRGGSPYAPFFALGGALLGGVLLHGLAGLAGGVVRASLRAVPGMRTLDSFGGLVFGAAAGLVLCWAIGAVLLYLPDQSELRRAVQRSAILSRINEEIPPQRLLETLEGVDPLGVIPGPPAAVPPPDAALARDPDVVAASRSVVRVTGIACGLGVEGSGWIVAPGLVVTNAHVVAGVAEPRVDRRLGRAWLGHVVAFDARNDLALVRVRGLRGRPLPLADPERGVPVALVGYPENGPLRRTPARLGATRELFAQDAYGSETFSRSVTAIRGRVRAGHSGGPGIDARGRVRTTVFARRSGVRGGGFGVPPALVRALLARAGEEPVPPTPCVRE